MITCKLCGNEMKGLTLHLIKKHNISPKEYCILFPNAKIFDDTCLNTDKRRSAFNKSKGVPKSENHKKNLSKSRIKWNNENKGWKQSSSMIEKIKETWDKKRDLWSNSIKKHWTEERKQKASKKQSQIIMERGYHLGHSTNSIERLVENIIKLQGFTVSRQVRSLHKIQDKFRYYDLYVIELNLIIEIDGEYWHRSKDKIQLDIEKEFHVRNIMKQNFIRISDKDLGRSKSQYEHQVSYIDSLLKLDKKDQILHCQSIIQERLKALEE